MTELLFSSTGRIGRILFLTLGVALLTISLAWQTWLQPILPGGVTFIVDCALLFSGACVLCKRLHDRGRAGWWAGLVLLALALGGREPYGLRQMICAAILLVAFVDLGLMPAQPRFNRFGLPPAEA